MRLGLSAPQIDCLNLSFVEDILVVGKEPLISNKFWSSAPRSHLCVTAEGKKHCLQSLMPFFYAWCSFCRHEIAKSFLTHMKFLTNICILFWLCPKDTAYLKIRKFKKQIFNLHIGRYSKNRTKSFVSLDLKHLFWKIWRLDNLI